MSMSGKSKSTCWPCFPKASLPLSARPITVRSLVIRIAPGLRTRMDGPPCWPRARATPTARSCAKRLLLAIFSQQCCRRITRVVRERPWIYACVVVPHTTELSGIRGIAVNPQFVYPRGQGRALLFQPAQLSAYIEKMSPEMDYDAARALVVALGGTVDGTWLEQKPIQQEIPRCTPSQPRPRLRLQIVWDD